ncbi:MAG: carboxypeptidase regulatory-like domain-containing protein [Acidobacteriaceae bacterium]
MRKLLTVLLFCCFITAGVSAGAQQTLGSLNGTVVDTSGAAVPGSTVTATDAAIGVTRTTKSQGNGFFQIFNLPVGTYSVKVTHDGFDTSELTGIEVQEAQAKTLPVTLKVGEVTQSVTVTATPLLNATDDTNGYTLDKAQIALTPLATGSFTQLAVLSPGVSAELLSNLDSNSGLGNQPIWANGQRDTSNTFQVNGVDATNLFNGKSSSGSSSQRYAFNIGQGATVGGAAGVGTSVFGSNGNSLPSPPPEFLQELRVNTSMYDAQQGATSGAQIDANTASGTNSFHGQLYGSFANNGLNAAPFYFKQEYLLGTEGVGAFPEELANPALHRWTTGFTAGGPIIKDKLFFFVGYQHRYNSDQATGISQMTVPSGLTDDRSPTGLNNALTSWYGGPDNSCKVGGVKDQPCSELFGPISAAIMNAKLPNGQYLIPSSQTPGQTVQYGVPNVTLLGTSTLVADQANVAVDYDVTSTDRLSAKYYYQNDPVNKPYGFSETGGFPVTQKNGAQVFALDNTITIGSKINWEQRLGFDRMGSYSFFRQTLAADPTLGANYGIGAGGTAGEYAAGLPGLDLAEFAYDSEDSSAVTTGPESAFVNMGYYQNRLNPSTNVIFSIGNHTIVAGGGYSYTQLNIENDRQGIADVKTKNFQTFLADEADTSAILESTADGRNNSNRYYRSNEIAGYVQDKWQALPNLSITAGVRYDYHGGLTEKYGNMFNFDPSKYDVTGTVADGFDVVNSGFVIAGNNKYDPTAGTSPSTLTGRQWGISPRVGFAYSPKRFNNKIVINGGAGVYYDRGELFTYLSQPAGSGNGGPFGVTESSPLASYIVGTGTAMSDPIGGAYAAAPPPTSNPAVVNQALQQTLGIGPTAAYGYSGANNPSDGQNCSGIDNQENYLDCPTALNFGVYDKNNVLPYTINFALNIQWQPTNDLAITIGYSGNRGRHSVIPIPFNEPGLATATNPIHGETATYGFEVLNANSESNGYDYDPIGSEPWNSEDGGNADFRTPYIGFSPNVADFKTVGESAYDSLQVHMEKRLSHHFQGGLSYTWGHALDEQSDIGLFFTGDNPNDLRDSYASSDFDRTHTFTANFQAQLPNFAREHSALSYVTNDWSLTGIGVVQSGEPYSLYEFYGAVGSAYFGDYPTLMNPVLPISNPKEAKSAGLTGNSGKFRGTGGDYIPTVNPDDIAINYITPGNKGVPTAAQGNAGDPVDIYETDFAPENQRNIFRQAMQKRLDLSFRKSFRVSNRISVQYEFNIFNATNTTSLDVPQDQTQIRQADACSTNANAGGNCSAGYVNYGQIATGSSTTDQQSALTNLDQKPIFNGSGKTTTIPTQLTVGQGSCTAYSTDNAGTCPNNGANFGSVTGTIGGGRAVTMGLHIVY